jgi:hypothetical protein
LSRWIAEHTDPRSREIEGVFADPSEVAVVLSIGELDTAVMQHLTMDRSGITHQTTLRWRDAHKPGGSPDGRLAWVDDLVARYLAFRLEPTPDGAAGLYHEDATVEPVPIGQTGSFALGDPRVAEVLAGDRSGPAAFVVPGAEPDIVGFVLETGLPGDCATRIVVSLGLEDRRIVTEQRMAEAGTPESCRGERPDLPDWWIDIEVPPLLEEQVTGTAMHPDGYDIPLVNGTEELQRLVVWGLGRFVEAGIGAPRVESISFDPVPACRDVSGIVVEDNGRSPNLVQCTDPYAACRPDRASCTSFDVSVRFALLHELGHVWSLENLDDDRRAAFLDLSGLEVWRSGDVVWHRRGVERAADTIAWGLMDERVPLTRFGDPECEETAAAFGVLTGAGPLVPCG